MIRQDRIEEFNARFETLRAQLDAAVRELNSQYTEIKSLARQRLGSLFNLDDYPNSLDDLFAFDWDFPSIEVPE